MAYLGRQPNTGVRSRYIYTATASQTTFSGSDDDGKTLKYEDAAYVDVFLNGVLLKPVTDYAATTKTSVVLTSGASASDIVEIVAYDIANIADTVSKANGGTFEADVTVQGTVTADGLSVDGGTIKLDGNYPVGTNNVALGDTALDSNVSGGSNTAIGADALTANTASNNTAVGYQAGYSNTTGTGNAFFGRISGYSNTADYNNAFGAASLYSNTSGTLNVAVGDASLYANTTGSYNTSIGGISLRFNTTANNNTAVGYGAGYTNSTGINHTLIGKDAGYSTTGSSNTFVGVDSGYFVSSGGSNTILGRYNGNQGGLDIRTSSNNIVLSDGAGNPRIRTVANGHTRLSPAQGSMASGGDKHIIHNTYNGNYTATLEHGGGSSPYGLNILYSDLAPNSGSNHFLVCSDIVNTKMVIFSNGNVANVNNSYGAYSDEKLKENIVDSGSQWDDIKALRVRKYSLKADELDAPNKLGVIAQEVEAAGMGGLVIESPDQDNDLNDLGTVTKSVNYSVLYMKAVKALQEAMERIETLEAKVAALETP